MEMFPERKSILRPGVVNLVGENHAESKPRRDLEKKFVYEMIGSDVGYWTEDEFPDEQWQPPSMSRSVPEKKGKKDELAADLMEYRGVHAAVSLVESFEMLCASASKVGARTDNKAGAAVAAFVDGNLTTFFQIMDRLEGTWKATEPDDVPKSGRDQYIKVNAAVQAAWTTIRRVLQNYLKMMRIAQGSLEAQLEATQFLGTFRADIPTLLQPLSSAVGASDDADAEELERDVQVARSRSMALAAGWSGQTGVWKVGNEHIDDLTKGRVKVQTRINIVSEEAFNREFKAWKLEKEQKEQVWQQRLEYEQRQYEQRQQRRQDRPNT